MENNNFDPMTGEPIRQAGSLPADEMNFDPMTGEPIRQAGSLSAGEMNFDPMTGEPIGQSSVYAGVPVSYEPMTGQPIYGGTGDSARRKKGRGAKAVVAVCICAVAVTAVLIIAFIRNGVFLSRPNKILLAAANTCEPGMFLSDLNILDILKGDEYTMALDFDVPDAAGEIFYFAGKEEKAVNFSVDITSMPEIEGTAVLDESALRLEAPMIYDDVFLYCYTEDNDGYLMDSLSDDEKDMINSALATLYSGNSETEEIREIFLDEFRNLTFEKGDKETFEIDGKDRNCKSYETTITSENVLNILEKIKDLNDGTYKDIMFEGDAYGELRDELREYMPDIDLTFYLYKNRFAAVEIKIEHEKVQIQFRGGKRPLEDVRVTVDKEEIIKIGSSADGDREKTKISVMGDTVLEVDYDKDSGKFEMEFGGDVFDNTSGSIEGTVKSDRNGVAVELEEIYLFGNSLHVSATFSAEKGADIPELSGDEFDIGNASEREIENAVEDISDVMGFGSILGFSSIEEAMPAYEEPAPAAEEPVPAEEVLE